MNRLGFVGGPGRNRRCCLLASAHATREAELDQLLRNQVLVDLYNIVRHGLLVDAMCRIGPFGSICACALRQRSERSYVFRCLRTRSDSCSHG